VTIALIISENIWQSICNTIKKKQSCEVYCLSQPSSKQINLFQQNVIGFLGYRVFWKEKTPQKSQCNFKFALLGLDFPPRTLQTHFFFMLI